MEEQEDITLFFVDKTEKATPPVVWEDDGFEFQFEFKQKIQPTPEEFFSTNNPKKDPAPQTPKI